MAALGLLVALVLLSALAPFIAPQDPADPLGFDPLAANTGPALSWTYLLGADGRGRSVLALLLWGGRVTLTIGVGAALLAVVVGVALGALACWRDGLLDPPLARLMDLCGVAPPLLLLLLLAARLGGVPAPLMLAVFALTGWVAPARLTRTAVRATMAAPYVEAARAAGVTGPRLLFVHLAPAALAPVAAWTAAGAATYVALEAGLDFLGLGLPEGTTSWGTALAGAQEAVAAGNWWWMTFGGAALALATLALAAVARGVGSALDPTILVARSPDPATLIVSPVNDAPTAEAAAVPAGSGLATTAALVSADAGAPLPSLREVWGTPRADAPRGAPMRVAARRGRRWPAMAMATGGVLLLVLVGLGVGARYRAPRAGLAPGVLLHKAAAYAAQRGQSAAYIATATYAASAGAGSSVRGLPWAAYGACPLPLSGRRCARADVQVWFSSGQGRAQSEGGIYVCTPRLTWGLNPMAGLAATVPAPCGPLGPAMSGLGATAGVAQRLLPAIAPGHGRLTGQDIVAGRPCWVLTLSTRGRVCVDSASGLALRVERLDHAGRPVALFVVTGISYGLDLAPQIFANPIPGGHGPLVNGLSQPLLDIQSADDVALFSALVPRVIPPGLTAQTPTYDSFYDQTRGYAPQDRVRQAYVDRWGRVMLVLIETLPGSAWDVTPPPAHAHRIVRDGQHLLVWDRAGGQPALARVESNGTAALVSSRTLPVGTLEQVAAGLR